MKPIQFSELKAGDRLIPDAGFTCMDAGVVRVVRADENTGDLFINCSTGRHYLDGQIAEDGTLVGLERAP